ncbi:MAG TPA: heavy metal-responsive transcriptional regulator [Microcoleaceae cyanobacterium]|jgi:DNA-binding transcriptional MerR regulator
MITSISSPLLKIGEVAAASGLPIKTIRYYEEIGLLTPTVRRSEAGYRLFSDTVLNRLAFIRRVQGLGLSLAEIGEILQVHDRGEVPCGEVKSHLELKLQDIRQQMAALKILETELEGLLSGWQEPPSKTAIVPTICPNIPSHIHPIDT